MSLPQLLPTAEPFFIPGERAKAGCLLIHGFTGTPKEMRWMGEFLASKGHTTLGVRLTGHATRPEDMIRSRWTDWSACVEDGYHLLRGAVDQVYLVGLSMGAALALLMAPRLDTTGVIAMSTPYQLPVDHPAWMYNLLSRVMPYRVKSNEPAGSSWTDKEAYREHISYPQNPLRSVAELKTLLGEMRATLAEVRVPVLLIHSRDDRYVPFGNLKHIHDSLVNAGEKQMMLIEGSGHVLTRDAARQQVFEAALEFIHKRSATA